MSTALKLQAPGNVAGSGTRVEATYNDGTTITLPTIQSGAVAENITGDVSGTITIANADGAPTLDWLDVSSPAAATATCSSISGRVAIDATATNVVVTNTKVGVGAIILLSKLSLDATLVDFKVAVNVAGGEFTITGDAAATADVLFDFVVINVTDVTPA